MKLHLIYFCTAMAIAAAILAFFYGLYEAIGWWVVPSWGPAN